MWNEGSEAVGPGMDCLQLRHQPAGPFHYLISEQAKSLVALQELQHEVGALLEFRDLVMETFPNLRTKLASSTPATMTQHHHHSNIPVSIRPGDWTPGIRVRKKLGGKDKKSGDVTVQDSGFSTETSSKETHSASSSAAPPSTTAAGVTEIDEAEDELWNLLDVIHRKGTRLKDEVEALQGSIREQSPLRENGNFQRALFHSSADDVRQLRQERDLLIDRLAEMEAEVIAGRVHTSRLQEDLENLLSAKSDLEEQLKAIVSQRGEVNSRIHDLHLQFVSKNSADDKVKVVTSDKKDVSSQRTNRSRNSSSISALDLILGDRIPKVAAPDSKKIAAILKEHDPIVLQKHLLTTTVQNQSLQQQLDVSVGLEAGLRDKLNKAREENEDLRFQLEDKSIELEGTRARVRLLEDLQKPHNNITSSPDIIPDLDITPDRPISRSEITTASMKAMSPLPMNLQMDHSSSTESAHDLTESNRKDSSKRRPSKIPLKSYTAPKPPGGKHSPAPGAPRSRSGESPHRSHSAHSWRNRSGDRSPSLGKDKNSLPKSRNTSLVSARDSLSNKLRSSESVIKTTSASGGGTLKKTSPASAKWTQKDEKVPNLAQTKEKYQYPWTLSSFNDGQDYDDEQINYHQELTYPDSLMADNLQGDSIQQNTETTTDSGSQRFQTANTFLWTTKNEFYDSIDSNLPSSCYRSNGEELAECDSLEKRLSDLSFEKQ